MATYPILDPETEAFMYYVEPACAESVSEIVSETESAASAVTIASDKVSNYFVTHHMRQQPASENAVRWLPSDNTRRDVLRHVVDKYVYGHNYLGPVNQILCSNPEARERQVLEIGTRGGLWIQEMATEFPHIQFRSLDIVPLVPHIPRPNVVFEVYDIADGLVLADNSQDIIFINMGQELVKNYPALLCESHRVLRPGGLIHIREFCPGLWDPKDDTKLAHETNPLGCRHFDILRSAIVKSGADPDTYSKLGYWLSPESQIWNSSNQSGGFEEINIVVKSIATFPHQGHPCTDHIAPHMIPLIGHLFVVCARDSVGLLCDSGMAIEDARLLIELVIEELQDPKKCPLLKLYTVYATKRA